MTNTQIMSALATAAGLIVFFRAVSSGKSGVTQEDLAKTIIDGIAQTLTKSQEATAQAVRAAADDVASAAADDRND
jgi:hypothetical protein